MTNNLATLALAATEAEKALDGATKTNYKVCVRAYRLALERFNAAATPSVVLALTGERDRAVEALNHALKALEESHA